MIFVEEAGADAAAHTLEWETGDRFELVPDGEGARLRVHHEPPTEGYDDIGEGWTGFVEQLRFALTRHRGEERATHYLPPTSRSRCCRRSTRWAARSVREHQLGLVVAGSATGCSSRSRSRAPPHS